MQLVKAVGAKKASYVLASIAIVSSKHLSYKIVKRHCSRLYLETDCGVLFTFSSKQYLVDISQSKLRISFWTHSEDGVGST